MMSIVSFWLTPGSSLQKICQTYYNLANKKVRIPEKYVHFTLFSVHSVWTIYDVFGQESLSDGAEHILTLFLKCHETIGEHYEIVAF